MGAVMSKRAKVSKLLFQRVDYAAPKEGDWVGPNVRFRSAEVVSPFPGVEHINSAILSADDERNPPETGLMERKRTRLKNALFLRMFASKDVRRHLTTALAGFCKQRPQESLQTIAYHRLQCCCR